MKLEVEGISKGFGEGLARQQVLQDIRLAIDFPRVLVLLGPSGGGKSTLLRILAGLELPDAGRVLFDGIPVPEKEEALRAYRRTLGVVFQAFNLFPHLTALENVVLPLTEVHRVDAKEASRRALEVMDRLGLASHAGKKPGQLSGGQRQRVAVARALATRPRLLLFDEPTSSLDPEMTAEVLGLLAELGDSGIPLILVTHEMGFARKVADQVVFLAGGRVLESGLSEEFFRSPQTPEASRFLGKVLAF